MKIIIEAHKPSTVVISTIRRAIVARTARTTLTGMEFSAIATVWAISVQAIAAIEKENFIGSNKKIVAPTVADVIPLRHW